MDLSPVENETAAPSEEATQPALDEAPPTSTVQGADSPAAEADAGADSEAEAPAPKPKPIQKRISELVREREAARRDAEYWRQQALQAQAAAPAAKPAEIKAEDYPTYEDYLIAKARTEAVASVESNFAKRAEDARREAEERERYATMAEFQVRAEEARARYADFDDVVSDPTTPITPLMADAIVASAVGHEVAYYLGRNKQEAARIANLPPLRQAMEIARLEGKVANPRRASSAPPPPRTVTGGATPARDPVNAGSYEEYVKLRRAQSKAR